MTSGHLEQDHHSAWGEKKLPWTSLARAAPFERKWQGCTGNGTERIFIGNYGPERFGTERMMFRNGTEGSGTERISFWNGTERNGFLFWTERNGTQPPNSDPDPKSGVVTKMFAPTFCAEWSDREVHSSHGDYFCESFDVFSRTISDPKNHGQNQQAPLIKPPGDRFFYYIRNGRKSR